MSKWLSPKEAGIKLGVDSATIINWIKARIMGEPSKLKAILVKKSRYFVSKTEINKILGCV